MEKKVIKTDKAASGKVPLSQAIQMGKWLFCSGQLPIDPITGEIVPGGIAEQTRRVLENLKAVCEEAGTSLKNAAKATIFMLDLNELLRETLDLMKNHKIMRGIRLNKSLMPHLPTVRGDGDQIKQVFLNLTMNACQAMNNKGVLTSA